MEIILRLEDFKLIKPKKNWIEKSLVLSTIINKIETSVWSKKLKFYYRFKDDEIKSFETLDEIVKDIHLNKYDTYVLQDSQDNNPTCGLYLNINDSGFSLIIFENMAQNKLEKATIDSMIKFTIDLYTEFHTEFLIGYRLGIELYEVEGFSPNDSIINDYWETYKIVDFLSLNYHKSTEYGRLNDYEKFSESKLNSKIEKYKKEDLLVINWNKDLKSPIADSMMHRDEWIHENLKP